MFKGVAFYFVLCWKYNKKFVLNLLLQEIITALNSILVILIPKYILDALFVEANKKAALQWALIYTFCVYLLSVFNNILQRFETIQTAQVFQQFSIDLNKKMMECKYQAIETPEFLDLKTKAECFLYGNGQGFGSILKHAFAIIGYILTLVGLSSIIMRLHIGLAFCITVLEFKSTRKAFLVSLFKIFLIHSIICCTLLSLKEYPINNIVFVTNNPFKYVEIIGNLFS